MRFAALIATAALLAPAAVAAQDVAGTWLTESGTSRVRISPCGAARCGTIVWTAREARDVNNPDANLRARNLVGVRMITDARESGGSWTGQLYNPLDGRTYTGRMRLRSAAELELSGCVLGGLICRSQTWSRVN